MKKETEKLSKTYLADFKRACEFIFMYYGAPVDPDSAHTLALAFGEVRKETISRTDNSLPTKPTDVSTVASRSEQE